MYVDLLKLKAYKLFENSDADLSWLLSFKEANLFHKQLACATIVSCLIIETESRMGTQQVSAHASFGSCQNHHSERICRANPLDFFF